MILADWNYIEYLYSINSFFLIINYTGKEVVNSFPSLSEENLLIHLLVPAFHFIQ